MKPHAFSLLAAAALAGCSSLPFEIEEGTKAGYTSTQSPRSVADCMTLNQRRNGFALTPVLVEGDKGALVYSLRASDGREIGRESIRMQGERYQRICGDMFQLEPYTRGVQSGMAKRPNPQGQ